MAGKAAPARSDDMPSLRNIRIRRARPADLAALVALENASFAADRLSARQYRRHLDGASAVVIAAHAGDALVGSAVLFLRHGSRVARLYSIAVAPAARGRGVASALLAAAEQAARRRGARCLRLEVRQDNAAAIALYERHGYHRFGAHRRYYEDGADAWRYERSLATRRRD
jgi:ribosomal protein S18 acetylase RimI-like enzyme